jgi:hypothetical protein
MVTTKMMTTNKNVLIGDDGDNHQSSHRRSWAPVMNDVDDGDDNFLSLSSSFLFYQNGWGCWRRGVMETLYTCLRFFLSSLSL